MAVPAGLYLIMLCILTADLWTMHNAVQIQGEVVGFDKSGSTSHGAHGAEGTTTYAPRISFDLDGEEYICRSKVYSSPRGFELGQSVILLVDPLDPEQCKLTEFFRRFFAEFVLFCIASTFAFIIGLAKYFDRLDLESSPKLAAINEKRLIHFVVGLFIAIGPILGLIGSLLIYNRVWGLGIFFVGFALLWSYGVYLNLYGPRVKRR